uniref:Uncharacterized protein n=1 Tax=viral metagenome TaxID=1070528 RepID=A0A6C0KB30_9ZZZZ
MDIDILTVILVLMTILCTMGETFSQEIKIPSQSNIFGDDTPILVIEGKFFPDILGALNDVGKALEDGAKETVKFVKGVGNEGAKLAKGVGNEGAKLAKGVGNEGAKLAKGGAKTLKNLGKGIGGLFGSGGSRSSTKMRGRGRAGGSQSPPASTGPRGGGRSGGTTSVTTSSTSGSGRGSGRRGR